MVGEHFTFTDIIWFSYLVNFYIETKLFFLYLCFVYLHYMFESGGGANCNGFDL